MPPTSDQPIPACTHERGPGTTVCLHCRREARIAASHRRRQLALRGSAGAIVLATFLAAGVVSASALRGRASRDTLRRAADPAPRAKRQGAVNTPTAKPDSVAQQGLAPVPSPATTPVRTPISTPVPTPTTTTGAASGSVATTRNAATAAPFGPVIGQGETPIASGAYAVRTDSAVSVFFDNPERRTRIPEKFEGFVRETLPKVFGSAADSALAKLAPGAIASQGNLLTDLPIRGVRIPVNPAWDIMLYPSTRPGRDGPLVIRYSAALMPANGVEQHR